MAAPAPLNTYDDVPYPSNPFFQTHPGHLSALAMLFGMRPAPADACRVLELGCASGGNLIPLALTYPESQFLGIDLSARQVADGQRRIADLGLTNVELRQCSILDVGPAFGEFDYIITHGVFSWVPPAVQDKMLDVLHRHLKPDGVGYVSYNTYPGWHLRGMIRDMMLYHTRRLVNPTAGDRIGHARQLLDFLASAVPNQESPYAQHLRQELELLRKHSDAYLYHEHLEENNAPLYFFEFEQRLAAKQLRYLGEADLSVMHPGTLPGEVQNVLNSVAPNQVQMEQYLDFVRNRTFRQTLVVHDRIQPNYTLRAEQMYAFEIAAPLTPKSAQPNLAAGVVEQFEGKDQANLTSSDPLVKAALTVLAEAFPQPMLFGELNSRARRRLGTSPAEDPAQVNRETLSLATTLLKAFSTGSTNLIELWLRPPRFTTRVSDRPVASPLARLQAVEALTVTSLRHQMVGLSEFARQLLPFCDGTRDREALLDAMVGRFQMGYLQMALNGVPVTAADQARELLDQALNETLPWLARMALFLA